MNDMIRILMIVITATILTACYTKIEEKYNPIKAKIENQIGFEFPDFIELDKEIGNIAFHGDYSNKHTLKFKKGESLDSLYIKIEERIKTQSEEYRIEDDCVIINDYWKKIDEGYLYTFMSECSGKDDKHLELSINSKDSIIMLTYGSY